VIHKVGTKLNIKLTEMFVLKYLTTGKVLTELITSICGIAQVMKLKTELELILKCIGQITQEQRLDGQFLLLLT
jgi:hypothetical protein